VLIHSGASLAESDIMAVAVRILLMAIVFLLPGGSVILAAYAARAAVKGRAWKLPGLNGPAPRPSKP
jgi:hypothetical protein